MFLQISPFCVRFNFDKDIKIIVLGNTASKTEIKMNAYSLLGNFFFTVVF